MKKLIKKVVNLCLIGLIVFSIIHFTDFYTELESLAYGMGFEILDITTPNYFLIILPSIIALGLIALNNKPKKRVKEKTKKLKKDKSISKTIKFLTAINDIYNEYSDQIQWQKEDLSNLLYYHTALSKINQKSLKMPKSKKIENSDKWEWE